MKIKLKYIKTPHHGEFKQGFEYEMREGNLRSEYYVVRNHKDERRTYSREEFYEYFEIIENNTMEE